MSQKAMLIVYRRIVYRLMGYIKMGIYTQMGGGGFPKYDMLS